jgi:hypothetical protein
MDQGLGPILGASVGLYSESGNWEMRADQLGRFFLERVPPGHYELEVTSPGFLAYFEKDYEVGTADPPARLITLIVGSRPPCTDWYHGYDGQCWFGGQTSYGVALGALGKPTMTGTVVAFRSMVVTSNNRSERLRDATVVLTRMGARVPFAELKSDETGQFRFPDLDVGRYEIWVRHDGCTDNGASNVRIKYGQDVDIRILIECPQESSIQ